MVKIFVGNLPPQAETEEIQALFSQYGTVTECAIIKNFAFVHMDDRKCATKAIRNLHLYKMHGVPINVEASHGKNQGPVKLHVANVEKGAADELRALFEEYGTVSECSVVKNFAFVHMPNSEEAMDAMKGLTNTEFQGKRIHVQISKSRPRGGEDEGYGPPDGPGYWPPRFPGDRPEPGPPGFPRGRFGPPPGPHGYPPAPPPPPPPPLRRAPSSFERDGYGVVDYYEKYRARPFGMAAPFEDRRVNPVPPPPPAPSAGIMRERLGGSNLDPYERRPLPPHPPSAYFPRDRSPIRRPPQAAAAPAGNGYSYERSRLSPLSMSRPPFGMPRPRDPYADRAPPPPPAAPRYTY